MAHEFTFSTRITPVGWKAHAGKVRWGVRYISDCEHKDKETCLQHCARGCGWTGSSMLDFCLGHWHCMGCGAVKCHSFWWRWKYPMVDGSKVANPARTMAA